MTALSHSSRTGSSTARPAGRRRRVRVGGLARGIVYVAIAAFFLLPFAWQLGASLRPANEIFSSVSPVSWRTFVPSSISLTNFAEIFGLNEVGRVAGLNFGRNLLNSVLVAGGIILGGLVVNTLAAYFFSRSTFRGKNAIFLAFIGLLLVPWEASIIPMYLVVDRLGMTNSYWALVVPWLANPLSIFFMRVMFDQLPREMDEAAVLDGANRRQILVSLLVPNAVPALITMCLLELQKVWNQFFWPLAVISSPEKQILQVVIAGQSTEQVTYWGRTFAGTVLACLPVIVFLLLQRHYTRGVASTGLKG